MTWDAPHCCSRRQMQTMLRQSSSSQYAFSRRRWPALRRAGFTLRRSLGLDVGGPDDLGPFLGFLGEELAVFGRRERKRRVAEVGNPRPNPGIGEAGVDLAIEPVDDLDGRVARRAKALGPARLETPHAFRDRRTVR